MIFMNISRMAFEGHMGGVDLPRRSFVRSLLEIRDILGGRLCLDGWKDSTYELA